MLFASCIAPDPGPIVWYGLVPFGALLLVLAFRSRPIRRIHGIGPKVKALLSNHYEGPDQNGRLFFGGSMFIIIGLVWLIACHL